MKNNTKKGTGKYILFILIILGLVGLNVYFLMNKDFSTSKKEGFYTIIEDGNKYLVESKNNTYEIIYKFPTLESVFLGKSEDRLYFSNYHYIMYHSLTDKMDHKWIQTISDEGLFYDGRCILDGEYNPETFKVENTCYQYHQVSYGKIVNNKLYFEIFDGPSDSLNSDENGPFKFSIMVVPLSAKDYSEIKSVINVFPDFWAISDNNDTIYYSYLNYPDTIEFLDVNIYEYNINNKDKTKLAVQDNMYSKNYLSATRYNNGNLYYLKCKDDDRNACNFYMGNYDYELRIYNINTKKDGLIYDASSVTFENLKEHFTVYDDNVYYLNSNGDSIFKYNVKNKKTELYYDLKSVTKPYNLVFKSHGIIELNGQYIYNGKLLNKNDSKLKVDVKTPDGTKKYSLVDINEITRKLNY